jgi:thiamine pyrophosphokinase
MLIYSVIPHIIKGDFDSIRPEVKKYYENAGSQVVHDSNQDTTDLQKALSAVSLLSRRDERLQKALLVVVGGLGGNISQELSNFNCMFESQDHRICFAGDTNVVMVMHPGMHTILSPPGIKCGIIPLGCPVDKVTTKGLKWNLSTWTSTEILCISYHFETSFSYNVILKFASGAQTATRSSLVVSSVAPMSLRIRSSK